MKATSVIEWQVILLIWSDLGCKSKHLSKKDVLRLVINKLKLSDDFTATWTLPQGCTGFPIEARRKIWSFWHDNSQESTNTTDIVSLYHLELMRSLPFIKALNTWIQLYVQRNGIAYFFKQFRGPLFKLTKNCIKSFVVRILIIHYPMGILLRWNPFIFIMQHKKTWSCAVAKFIFMHVGLLSLL